MKFKGTLIVVKDCNRALKFYCDMFGFSLIQDNDGNMELTDNLYLQELRYWERFTEKQCYNILQPCLLRHGCIILKV